MQEEKSKQNKFSEMWRRFKKEIEVSDDWIESAGDDKGDFLNICLI